MACIQLRNSDNDKYGTLKTKIASDYSLGKKLYPTSIKLMTVALDDHKWDPAYGKRKENEKQQRRNKDNENNTRDEGALQTNFAQQIRVCFCCGSK